MKKYKHKVKRKGRKGKRRNWKGIKMEVDEKKKGEKNLEIPHGNK